MAPQPAREKLDFRFALRPQWILLHLGALAGLAVMISAMFWQLDRLQQKQDRNALVEQRTAQPVVDVREVLAATDGPEQVDAVEYRIVTATGRYAVEDEVFVRNRTFDGSPGAWVLTPLVLDDGTAVVVNRGWIPASNTSPTLPEGAEAPAGTVTVDGLLLPGQSRGSFGAADATGERLPTLARADLLRLQQQVEADLFPAYLQVLPTTGEPFGVLPRPIPAPERGEGPHRGYAGQWFLFAVIWVIGYPLLIRRSAQRRARGEDDDLDGPPTADRAGVTIPAS